jgi:uncharacterized protein
LKTSPLSIYFPKDFLETAEGLMFAVVHKGLEQVGGEDKALCFLRYIQVNYKEKQSRHWQKLNTDAANEFLKVNHPEYLHYSVALDAHLHAVAVNRIVNYHQPRQRLLQLVNQQQLDPVEQDCFDLCQMLKPAGVDLAYVGVTGSLLIGAQKATSDVDLVIYDRQTFHHARALMAKLIETGELSGLTEADWREAYKRRGCALTFDEYVWHEQRKYNKGMINRRKFDLGLLTLENSTGSGVYRKSGAINLEAKVTESSYSFDYPAVYNIDHDTIGTVVCFIATYTGQAVVGETVEIAGLLEQADDGEKRIVVGSSREAPGEYIKVISCPH